jgi:hypothetical protein
MVIAPLSFSNLGAFHPEILNSALEALKAESGLETTPLGLFAVPCTLQDSLDPLAEIAEKISSIHAIGADILFVATSELYKIAAFVNRYTRAPVRFALGIPALMQILSESYDNLNGKLLEAISRLFLQNVSIYVSPLKLLAPDGLGQSRTESESRAGNRWLTADQLSPEDPLGQLYKYLLKSRSIVPLGPPEVHPPKNHLAIGK